MCDACSTHEYERACIDPSDVLVLIVVAGVFAVCVRMQNEASRRKAEIERKKKKGRRLTESYGNGLVLGRKLLLLDAHNRNIINIHKYMIYIA